MEEDLAWIRFAESNSRKCVLCARIVSGNRYRGGTLVRVRVAGVEFSREMQLSHLAHCRGKGSPNRPEEAP